MTLQKFAKPGLSNSKTEFDGDKQMRLLKLTKPGLLISETERDRDW